MNKSFVLLSGTAAVLIAASAAIAQQSTFDINKITESGVGEKIGSVTIADDKKGTSFKVAVKGLAAGPHGFHVHEKGDCGPGLKDGKMEAGIAAGDHFDPEGRKTHKGPQGAGHKGDLPVLTADAKGIIQTVTAPRLKLSDIQGRALVIHEAGDTYNDQPASGGGKGRIACGVIPKG